MKRTSRGRRPTGGRVVGPSLTRRRTQTQRRLAHAVPGAVMSSSSHPNGPNIVGNYYRVGRKIGEGTSSQIPQTIQADLGPVFLRPQGALASSSKVAASAHRCSLLAASRCVDRSLRFTGTNLLNSSQVAIKFVRPLSSFSALVAPRPTPTNPARLSQEPRKSDAPQLRDECRSYRTLAGTRKCQYCLFVRPRFSFAYFR